MATTATTTRHGRAALLILAVMVLTTVSAVTGLVQALSNTFHDSATWITSKTFLERGTVGGVMFRVTRVALFRDRVDLGSWFGFQEIIRDEDLPLRALDFAFKLDDRAWLAVMFNGENHEFDAVRLSRDPLLPSLACSLDRKRLFTRKFALDNAPEIGPGWHRGRLEIAHDRYRLFVDDALFDEREAVARQTQRIGFKGGGASALVDDIVMTCDGQPDRVETFSNRRGIERTVAWITALVLTLHGIIIVIVRAGRLRWSRPAIVYHLVVAMFCASGSLLAYVLDHVWLASRYPKDMLAAPEYPNTIVFEADPIPPPVEHPAAERYRIMFVGSSQTWGAGATLESDTWVRRVEHALNARPDRARRFECLNTGINGATSATLLPRYRDEWLATKPQMTVINLSHNDWDMAEFGLNLAAFAQLNREAGVKTVLLLEPNTHQSSTFSDARANVPHNHTLIRRLGDEFGIEYIDMQAKMHEDRDRGFLWWDLVHLTSAGQAVFAENLVEELAPLLP